MGRSVSYPRDAVVVAYNTVDPGDWIDIATDGEGHEIEVRKEPTQEEYQWEFEAMQDWLISQCMEFWPSLKKCDVWIGREDQALLVNSFAYIGLSEYCGTVAFWIIPLTDEYSYDEPKRNICKHWCNQIAPRFEETFGSMKSIGHMSNGGQVFRKT